jgi:hypothetical protein
MKALHVINKDLWRVCIQSQVENNPTVLYHLSLKKKTLHYILLSTYISTLNMKCKFLQYDVTNSVPPINSHHEI